MSPHLVLRVHADLRLGLGHVARALAVQGTWKALGGTCTLAVSGDERARRVGSGRHPFRDEALPCEAVDLGTDAAARLPEALKQSAQVVLVDQWDVRPEDIQALRPLKVAVMEDDGEAHERADLLFQPFLEGVKWEDHPFRTEKGRKLRPYEALAGDCRVVRGASFIVVDRQALDRRPGREMPQPLAVHKLLVTFGGSDGAGLSQRAYEVLKRLVAQDRWMGTCTILAPGGIQGDPFPGCTILPSLPDLTRRIQDFDALWCAHGVTLCEAACLGVPAAVWAQNERQHGILADLALANGCFDLGIGGEADLDATADALDRWLGPEGQETRQEQSREGMRLVDGLGARRIAQELWKLAEG